MAANERTDYRVNGQYPWKCDRTLHYEGLQPDGSYRYRAPKSHQVVDKAQELRDQLINETSFSDYNPMNSGPVENPEAADIWWWWHSYVWNFYPLTEGAKLWMSLNAPDGNPTEP